MTFDAELLAAGRARGNAERDRAAWRRHVDFSAEHGFGQRHRDADFQIVSAAMEVRVRGDVDCNQQVPRAAWPRLALAAKANLFALVDSGGDFDAN